jgi:hypothetical protein
MAPAPPCIATTAELNLLIRDGSLAATFVAIDLEGGAENIVEVGLAICSRLTPLNPGESYASFIQDNEINCSTIQLHQNTRSRERHQERLQFGDQINAIENENDFESIIHSRLRPFSSQYLILVVFDSHAELKWAARACPSLLQIFSAYVDAQTLAANISDNLKPSLRQCLKTLNIAHDIPTHKNNRPHRAGNDTVYTLALLAALLSHPSDAQPLVISTNQKKPKLFTGRPTPTRKYPFTAQIITRDSSPLPLELDTAGKIYRHFSSFNPIAAGTGVTKKKRPSNSQLSWSWICFSTKDHLDAFISATNLNSKIFSSGKTIVAESHYHPGVTLTKEERKAKQLEDGERIREERRKTRLLKEDTMVAN